MSAIIVQPIPYQGSKRNLAGQILKYFPDSIGNLYEPFAGSAAITIAAAYQNKAQYFHINDINAPLMHLWDCIINTPETLAADYSQLWHSQLGREKDFFIEVRNRFNQKHLSGDFLYLLARSVKGAIRYNTNGEFNQSPDNRRRGKHPATMLKDICIVSKWLRGRTSISAIDYRQATSNATGNDLIYLDPPYQGTCTGRDNRYFSGIVHRELIEYLTDLNLRSVPWILSYDGTSGGKTYGSELPSWLNAYHLNINAGRSSQATLNGVHAITTESLYLSESLAKKIDLHAVERNLTKMRQAEFSFEEFSIAR